MHPVINPPLVTVPASYGGIGVDRKDTLSGLKLSPEGPGQAAVRFDESDSPQKHITQGSPDAQTLRRLSDKPVVDRTLSYYIKPSYWQRIQAAVKGQSNNAAHNQMTSGSETKPSDALKQIGKEAASLVESLVEDQHYLEPVTLVFALGHIYEGRQAAKMDEYLRSLSPEKLAQDCKKYFHLLMTDIEGACPTPEMLAIKELFERTNQDLIQQLDKFKNQLRNYVNLVDNITQFDELATTEGIDPEITQKVVNLKKQACSEAKGLLEQSAQLLDNTVGAALEKIQSDHKELLNVLDANQAVMGGIKQSAWGSFKRNLSSFVSSVLSVANVIFTGIAYLKIPYVSGIAGVLSELSKMFLIPGYKSTVMKSLKEAYEAYQLSQQLHNYRDTSDKELLAITESLQRNQNVKAKVFAAGFALFNAVLFAGSALLVGATILAGVGVTAGSALAVLSPAGLCILTISLCATGIFSAYKGVRSIRQSLKQTHWQKILEDTQKNDYALDSGSGKYSKAYLTKMEVLAQKIRKENPQLDSKELMQQTKDQLQQQAIRKLMQWDPEFAVYALMERLRETNNPEIVQSTKNYLVNDLKALTLEEAKTFALTTGAAREKAELILKVKLGIRSSALYGNALPKKT